MTDHEQNKSKIEDDASSADDGVHLDSVDEALDDNVDKTPDSEPIETKTDDDWKGKYMYLLADVENMKKRLIKEKADIIQNANEYLLTSIFPVLDNLELAVRAVKDAEQKLEDNILKNTVFKNLVMGVEMTLKHFIQTLSQVGVQPIEALHKAFDPKYHEAVGEESDESKAEGMVLKEVQKGFTLHGRVIRPARVLVNRILKKDS